jgi:hypothetical protein
MTNYTDQQIANADTHSQSSSDPELFSHDEMMIALLDAQSKSTFLGFLDQQLRASEHHYLEHGDAFSLGYLEGLNKSEHRQAGR